MYVEMLAAELSLAVSVLAMSSARCFVSAGSLARMAASSSLLFQPFIFASVAIREMSALASLSALMQSCWKFFFQASKISSFAGGGKYGCPTVILAYSLKFQPFLTPTASASEETFLTNSGGSSAAAFVRSSMSSVKPRSASWMFSSRARRNSSRVARSRSASMALG